MSVFFPRTASGELTIAIQRSHAENGIGQDFILDSIPGEVRDPPPQRTGSRITPIQSYKGREREDRVPPIYLHPASLEVTGDAVFLFIALMVFFRPVEFLRRFDGGRDRRRVFF